MSCLSKQYASLLNVTDIEALSINVPQTAALLEDVQPIPAGMLYALLY